jgi:glycosyltransferase involved in cell wall biosynthesis
MLRNHAVAVALLRTVLRGFRLRMRRFAAQLIAADALVFMDRPNLAVTRQLLGVPIPKPQFVPVAIPAVEARPGHRKRAPLRLVWVGRLADFKVFSLKRALRDARAAAGELGTPVVFDVIGDGPLRHVVETGAGPGPGFEVRFLGDRSPAELEAHLREHADAVFAMGTSALEAARLGIPTVLLDIAYGELPPSYTYRFLDEAQGLSLGDVIGETRRPDDGRGMAETLRQVRDDSGPLAERCLAYFRGHHELGAVAETFLDALDRTTLTWSAIQSGGFLAKPMSYRLLVAGRSWASLRRLVPQGSA